MLLARLMVLLVSTGVAVATVPSAPPATATTARSDLERRVEDVLVGLHDQARRDPARFGHGEVPAQAPLTGWTDLRDVARSWSDEMGRRRQLSHNDGYRHEVCCAEGTGENVGYRTVTPLDAAAVTAAARRIFQDWMDSAGHRANVVDGRFDEIGVGARIRPHGDDWAIYVTVDLRDRHPAGTPDGVVYHRPARAIGDTCDGSGSSGYRDVPSGHAHHDTIACITAHHIAEGSGGRYEPDAQLRRGQLASFLVRTLAAAGAALPDRPRDHFDDDDGTAHEHNLNVLAEIDVIDRSDRHVGPHVVVTRETMASWTAAALTHGGGLDPDRPLGDHFSDDDASGAQHVINQLADAGVVTGRGDGTFAPGAPLRRDQMGSFLARSLDLLLDT